MADEDTLHRVRAVEQQVQQIRELQAEIATVVWGDMVRRDNGLRKRTITLEEWKAEIEEWATTLESKLTHFLDVERKKTCHGLAALAQHEAMDACLDEEESEEEIAVKTATINAGATTGAAKWTAVAMICGQILSLAGILFVALKK